MGNSKIKGKDLKKINFVSDKAKSLAIDIMHRQYKHISKAEKLKLLEHVFSTPEAFLGDENLSKLAMEFSEPEKPGTAANYGLRQEERPYKVYGKQHICENTIRQMDMVMRLPKVVKGALMPDAHVGYGIPIGGVVATENVVIPYGVGLDIGCRMSLTLFDVPTSFLKGNLFQL